MNGRPTQPAGQVRIVGGRWRGTRLAVPHSDGLRPSADRVRETLFNWLQPVIGGTHVLDLFAGTGALGLEAVSRGAQRAVLVERDARLAQALQATCARLPGGDAVQVVNRDALQWLAQQPAAGFDLAFVDPPFAQGVWDAVLAQLPRVLTADAWLYVEADVQTHVAVPDAFRLHRQGQTRQVRYALYRRATLAAGTDAGTSAQQ